MIIRYKIIITIFILICISSISVTFSYKQYYSGRNEYHEYKRNAQARQREASNEIARRCATFGPPSEAIRRCIADAVTTYQAEADTSEDLQAQKDMAYWGMVMFFTSIASLIISLGGLVALINSLSQTRTAIQNDREIGEAQARAYLSFSKIDAVFENHNGGPFVSIRFRPYLKNTGNTPAIICKVNSRSIIIHEELDIISINKSDWRVSSMRVGSNNEIFLSGSSISWNDIVAAQRNSNRIALVARIEFKDIFEFVWIEDFVVYAVLNGQLIDPNLPVQQQPLTEWHDPGRKINLHET